ncbi:MAG: adenylate/guanylate cyclase domain-containing protein [Gammaproteobacteria bacterium]|nr:adenylate/guanylate cyclase domain-containing protein [Gammaproteobacteria bacterium]
MAQDNYEKTAIMFADVEGSTRLYERLGDIAAQKSIEYCLSRMADVIQSHKGTVIKTIGDEIMCRFATEDEAVGAACALQESMELPAPEGITMPAIRIGLHYGLVVNKDGDIFGDAVNVAARMASIAKGKQIITTQDTIVNLKGANATKAREFDRAMVKGKAEEITIYEVLWNEENVTRMQTASSLAAIATASTLTLSYQGKDYELNAKSPDVVMGRDERCTIRVDSNFASRVHARVEYRRGKFVLIDQSTNGTYVDTGQGEPIYIRREELPLMSSGAICLGEPTREDAPHLIRYRAG